METAYWDTSTESFRSFFDTLEATIPISLTLTKKILQKKCQIINVKLPYLVRELRSDIHEIEALEKDREAIKAMITNPDKSDYTREVDIVRKTMEEIEEPNCYSTWCKKCETICHYPCHMVLSHDMVQSISCSLYGMSRQM